MWGICYYKLVNDLGGLMFTFDIKDKNIKKVHFIGIGGVSMSGLAELLFRHGFTVTGSDRERGKYVRHLEYLDIDINIGQKAENIKDQDLFVYTDAISPECPELIAAKNSGKPCVTRGQFLGAIMRNYKHSISVSGSHGKSTTTSMLAEILLQTKEDPTILIGGSLKEIGGNVLSGKENIFLAEGCEYKGNIRYYFPSIAVVLNIDVDHLDYYKNLDDIIHTFQTYMENLGKSGVAVINADDPNSSTLEEHVSGKVLKFSMEDSSCDLFSTNIKFDEAGHPSFDIVFYGSKKLHIDLQILGSYNIYNALAAAGAAYEAGATFEEIKKGLENFRSLGRRMEEVGTFSSARVLTDYGHHPREIRATLKALRPHVIGKLYCVFEPHTYSRTRTLMSDFASSFKNCDLAIITKIYGAREVDDGSVRSEELVEKINLQGDKAVYMETYDDVLNYLKGKVNPNDLILTTGCGKADQIAKVIVKGDSKIESPITV